MKRNLALLLGLVATAGCAGHYAQWVIAPQSWREADRTADSAFRSLGYLAASPPTHDPAAAARVMTASQWWTVEPRWV